MADRLDLLLVGEPALFGAVVPAGLLYAITSLPQSVAPIGDAVVLVWFAAIALGFAALGEWRELPTVSLLGGGIVGTIAGFWAFSALVGWSSSCSRSS